MPVYLGRGVSVRAEEILLLCDLTAAGGAGAAPLMDALRREGRLRALGPAPKTLVLCDGAKGDTGYLSCVGLRTLRERAAGGLPARRESEEVRND